MRILGSSVVTSCILMFYTLEEARLDALWVKCHLEVISFPWGLQTSVGDGIWECLVMAMAYIFIFHTELCGFD